MEEINREGAQMNTGGEQTSFGGQLNANGESRSEGSANASAGEEQPRDFSGTTSGSSVKDRVKSVASSVKGKASARPSMLADGPYPPRLKSRVGGDFGHLANEQTADLAAKLRNTRVHTLYLGHLSRRNNTPERALAVVRPRCAGVNVHVIEHGVPQAFSVYPARAAQLALPLGGASPA